MVSPGEPNDDNPFDFNIDTSAPARKPAAKPAPNVKVQNPHAAELAAYFEQLSQGGEPAVTDQTTIAQPHVAEPVGQHVQRVREQAPAKATTSHSSALADAATATAKKDIAFWAGVAKKWAEKELNESI